MPKFRMSGDLIVSDGYDDAGYLYMILTLLFAKKGLNVRNLEVEPVDSVSDCPEHPDFEPCSLQAPIELDDGGCIEYPDEDGNIRCTDKDGDCVEVRVIGEPEWQEWADYFDLSHQDFDNEEK